MWRPLSITPWHEALSAVDRERICLLLEDGLSRGIEVFRFGTMAEADYAGHLLHAAGWWFDSCVSDDREHSLLIRRRVGL